MEPVADLYRAQTGYVGRLRDSSPLLASSRNATRPEDEPPTASTAALPVEDGRLSDAMSPGRADPLAAQYTAYASPPKSRFDEYFLLYNNTLLCRAHGPEYYKWTRGQAVVKVKHTLDMIRYSLGHDVGNVDL